MMAGLASVSALVMVYSRQAANPQRSNVPGVDGSRVG